MLEDLGGKPINSIPRQDTYALIDRMSANEMAAIRAELNSRIDSDEIHTAGWMPGDDWTNTPFEPIYEIAAQRNYELAGWIFGLIVWAVFMDRPETWVTGRFEKDGESIGSRTYFRKRV